MGLNFGRDYPARRPYFHLSSHWLHAITPGHNETWGVDGTRRPYCTARPLCLNEKRRARPIRQAGWGGYSRGMPPELTPDDLQTLIDYAWKKYAIQCRANCGRSARYSKSSKSSTRRSRL